MSQIDAAKEEINYLKLWLGVAVVSDISLVSWFIASVGHVGTLLPIAALMAMALTTMIITFIHYRISERIQDLEDL